MKPKPFDYVRAETLDEALDALARHGADARILAGGQSQVAMLNFRLIETEVLIDITRIEALDYIRIENGALEIGAATRQSDLKDWPGLAEKVPMLHAALPFIGHVQTRNRGTVCGSIAHSDPSSELPLCLAVLEGEVVLRSKRAERTLKAADFQLEMLTTARAPDEMITAVRFPLGDASAGHAFDEMNRRRGDFAIVSLAAVARQDSVRLGVGGVAGTPKVRNWSELRTGDIDEALNAFAWELGGHDDIHGTARYRRELVRRLGRQVIEEARSCRR